MELPTHKNCPNCEGEGSYEKDCFNPMSGSHWTEPVKCRDCDGSGEIEIDYEDCERCEGEGKIAENKAWLSGGKVREMTEYHNCGKCNGTGMIDSDTQKEDEKKMLGMALKKEMLLMGVPV